MNFDSPAIIHECDGCGKTHHSIEQWILCLSKYLSYYKTEVIRLRPMEIELKRIQDLGPSANKFGRHWSHQEKKKNGQQK